jgi:protein-tyrosine phosphatase
MEYLIPLHHAKVIDHVFIGDILSPIDNEFLIRNNITLIINCSGSRNINKLGINTIEVYDFQDRLITGQPNEVVKQTIVLYNIIEWLVNKMNEDISRGGNVLVHCHAGMNRSALVIAMYLRLSCKLDMENTMKLLSRANTTRGIPVLTNSSFVSMIEGIVR